MSLLSPLAIEWPGFLVVFTLFRNQFLSIKTTSKIHKGFRGIFSKKTYWFYLSVCKFVILNTYLFKSRYIKALIQQFN